MLIRGLARNPAAPDEVLFRRRAGAGATARGPRLADAGAVRRLVARDPAVDPRWSTGSPPARAVRRAMAECPRLPVGRILALLDDPDPDPAESAAANPALPVERMRRIAGR